MNINTITNIFGIVAGVPQIVLGVTLFASDVPSAIAKLCEGVGIFVVSYFVGKKVPT